MRLNRSESFLNRQSWKEIFDVLRFNASLDLTFYLINKLGLSERTSSFYQLSLQKSLPIPFFFFFGTILWVYPPTILSLKWTNSLDGLLKYFSFWLFRNRFLQPWHRKSSNFKFYQLQPFSLSSKYRTPMVHLCLKSEKLKYFKSPSNKFVILRTSIINSYFTLGLK